MEKYLKEIVEELRLIRKELDYMNGVEMTKDGRKMSRSLYSDLVSGKEVLLDVASKQG